MIEFILMLPVYAFLFGVIVAAGLFGMELVDVQGLARESARAAAVEGDAAAVAVARASSKEPVLVSLDPVQGRRAPGDLVTAEVSMRSSVFRRLGRHHMITARATMRVEN